MKTNSWTNSWFWLAKPKTYRHAPTHWLKFYEEAVIGSEARTAVVQLKSEAWCIAINNDWGLHGYALFFLFLLKT